MGHFRIICFFWIASTALGTSSSGPRSRILGGSLADRGEYPSQLTLQRLSSHSCGASIINENFALTAAQCVDGILEGDLGIRAGSLDVNGGVRHQITRIIIHEDYDILDSFINDIAVLEVSPPFSFDSNTQPAVLASQGDEPVTGATATVIGWGVTSIGAATSDLLYEADLLISDFDFCLGAYESLGLTVHSGQICAAATAEFIGSCSGDAGGPLFVDGVIVGLVSWANGCAVTGFPTVHTKVAYYRDWIDQQVGVL